MKSQRGREKLYSVFVGGLPVFVNEKDVSQLFSSCGLIEDLWITTYPRKAEKYGFVRYGIPGEALSAVTKFHNTKFHGSKLIVDYSKDTVDRINEYKKTKTCHLQKDVQQIPKEFTRRTEKRVENETTTKSKMPIATTSKVAGCKSSMKLYSLFASNIHGSVSENELKELFSKYGEVIDLQLYVYKDSGKKYVFVTYFKPDDVVLAVQELHMTKLKGLTIRVQIGFDTVGRISQELLCKGNKPFENVWKKKYYSVFVGHLHSNVTETELTDLFGKFGEVKDIFINKDGFNCDQKYGFIRYATPEPVLNAVTHLNGWKLKDQCIIVDFAKDTIGRINKASSKVVPKMSSSTTVVRKCKRNREMDSILCRSRLQEAYFSLNAKLLSFSGTLKYSTFSNMIYLSNQSYKNVAIKDCSSCQFNFLISSTANILQTRCSTLASKIFSDKTDDLNETIEKLMKEIESQKPARTKESPAPTASPKKAIKENYENRLPLNTNRNLSKSKLFSLNNASSQLSSSPLSSVGHSTDTSSDNTRNSSVNEKPSTVCNLMNENNKDITILELGRQLKKQMTADNRVISELIIPHNLKELHQVDELCTGQKIVTPLKENGYKMKSQADQLCSTVVDLWEESNNKMKCHYSWASDLFCEMLDSGVEDGGDSLF